MRVTAFSITFLICTSCFNQGCKDDGADPPTIPERVKLTLIDVAVKETYLHIAVTTPASNETLALQRSGATTMTFPAVADTNIADTALTQTTAYQYTATLQTTNATTGKSNTITTQTLAPTSHNFTWQTFLLGDGNNSSLSDVAIINDTLIYAVGEMYLRDSTGAIDNTPYNLAKWNGHSWQIERVTVSTRFGWLTLPLEDIAAFSPTDIWVVSGSPIHWDGQRWTYYDTRLILNNENVVVSKAWGMSSSSMYFVGPLGSVVHLNNGQWLQLVSGTTTRINDAWGVINPVTGKEEVYCPVTSFFEPRDKRILKITDHTRVDSIRWDTGRNIFSVWTSKGFPIYTAGSGSFENSRGPWREASLPSIYTNAVRGTSPADVVVAGDFGLVAHFNGISWQVLNEVYNAAYGAISINGNTVAIVGERNSKGVVTIGLQHSM